MYQMHFFCASAKCTRGPPASPRSREREERPAAGRETVSDVQKKFVWHMYTKVPLRDVVRLEISRVSQVENGNTEHGHSSCIREALCEVRCCCAAAVRLYSGRMLVKFEESVRGMSCCCYCRCCCCCYCDAKIVRDLTRGGSQTKHASSQINKINLQKWIHSSIPGVNPIAPLLCEILTICDPRVQNLTHESTKMAPRSMTAVAREEGRRARWPGDQATCKLCHAADNMRKPALFTFCLWVFHCPARL